MSERSLSWLRAGNAVLGRVAPDATAALNRRLFMTPRRHEPRPWEQEAETSGERVTLAGNLRALRWGRTGPLALLMHGWEGRATQWARFVGPLLAAGRQVVALDGPAHGTSPGREASVPEFARALLAVSASLGEVDALLGHSMGGAASAFALGQGLRARRVALLASPSSVTDVLDRFTAAVGLPPAAARRFVLEVERAVGLSARGIDVAELGSRLKDVPALIVHDPTDDEVPFADAEAITAAWPGARLLRVDGVGHRKVLRDPRVVAEVTSFLTS